MEFIREVLGIISQYYSYLLSGVGYTMLIALIGTAAGFLIGLLTGVIRTAPKSKNAVLCALHKIVNAIIAVYIEVFRGTPMMVQAMVIYWGYAFLNDGATLPLIPAGLFIVSINTGAYMAEIVRGGLNGVSKGQFEAGYAQGFNTAEVLLYIVLPQAYRNIVPTLLSQVITTIKDSSYLANVATIELMARIRQLLSAAGTYNGLGTVNVSDVMVLFGAACVIYFVINFTLSCVVRSMQNRRKKALVFAPAKAA